MSLAWPYYPPVWAHLPTYLPTVTYLPHSSPEKTPSAKQHTYLPTCLPTYLPTHRCNSLIPNARALLPRCWSKCCGWTKCSDRHDGRIGTLHHNRHNRHIIIGPQGGRLRPLGPAPFIWSGPWPLAPGPAPFIWSGPWSRPWALFFGPYYSLLSPGVALGLLFPIIPRCGWLALLHVMTLWV